MTVITLVVAKHTHKSYDKHRQRHHLVNKSTYSQSYGFSSSRVQMWELDHKEGWVPKNQYFWIMVLEKTLESPLDIKEIKPVNPKGNQAWIFIGRTDTEVPILCSANVKSQFTGKDPNAGKDWGQEKKEATEDEMAGWHHWLNGHEFEETPGDSEGQGSLSCRDPWALKYWCTWCLQELDTSKWLNNKQSLWNLRLTETTTYHCLSRKLSVSSGTHSLRGTVGRCLLPFFPPY